MEEQQQNINPEQRNQMLEQRKQRLQSMGLPMPVTPIAPSGVVNVKDPNMLKRIQEIRSGNLKQEFKSFEKKADGKPDFEEIPAPKQKQKPGTPNNQSQTKIHVPLEEFSAKKDPNIDALDKMFNFDTNTPQTASGLREQFNSQIDDGGKSFVSDFRNRMQNRLQEKVNHQTNENYSFSAVQQPQFQSGTIILNEEDLKKKIIEITKPLARQIATDVIKEVLNEYAKKTNSKSIVSEKASNKFEGELLPDGKIKIGGKIFKLSADKK
jgi:hypothetical protein